MSTTIQELMQLLTQVSPPCPKHSVAPRADYTIGAWLGKQEDTMLAIRFLGTVGYDFVSYVAR